MNERVKRLKASLQVQKYPICIEKFKITLDTYAQTENEPQVTRRAKVFANVLARLPIFIEADQLIAGSPTSQFMGLEIDAEYGVWSQEEIDSLKNDNYVISPEDEKEFAGALQDIQAQAQDADHFHGRNPVRQ